MIRCHQVTKIFCTRYGSAIASSARGPCNFGPLTDPTISVFMEMSRQTTGVPVPSSTLKLDTGTGEGSFSFRSSLSRVSLSLDVAVVGEEDELVEDVEQCLSCFEGDIEVE